MTYIKLLGVPLRCNKCGVTRVALGMGVNKSLRTRLDGEIPTITYDECCPECGERMTVDPAFRNY